MVGGKGAVRREEKKPKKPNKEREEVFTLASKLFATVAEDFVLPSQDGRERRVRGIVNEIHFSLRALEDSYPDLIRRIEGSIPNKVFKKILTEEDVRKLALSIYSYYRESGSDRDEALNRTWRVLYRLIVYPGSSGYRVSRGGGTSLVTGLGVGPGGVEGLRFGLERQTSTETTFPSLYNLGRVGVSSERTESGLLVGGREVQFYTGNVDVRYSLLSPQELAEIYGTPISPLSLGLRVPLVGSVGLGILWHPPILGGEQFLRATLSPLPGVEYDITRGVFATSPGQLLLAAAQYWLTSEVLSGNLARELQWRGVTYIESSGFWSDQTLDYLGRFALEYAYALAVKSPIRAIRDFINDAIESSEVRHYTDLADALLKGKRISEEELNRQYTLQEGMELLRAVELLLTTDAFQIDLILVKFNFRNKYKLAAALANRFLKYRNLPPMVRGRLMALRDHARMLSAVSEDDQEAYDELAQEVMENIEESSSRLDDLREKWEKGEITDKERREFITLLSYLQTKMVELEGLGPLSPAFFEDNESFRKIYQTYSECLMLLDKEVRASGEKLESLLKGEGYNEVGDYLIILSLAAKAHLPGGAFSTFMASRQEAPPELPGVLASYSPINRSGFTIGDVVRIMYYIRDYREVADVWTSLQGGGYGNAPPLIQEVFGDRAEQVNNSMWEMFIRRLNSFTEEGWEYHNRVSLGGWFPPGSLWLDFTTPHSKYMLRVGNATIDLVELQEDAEESFENAAENLGVLRENMQGLEESSTGPGSLVEELSDLRGKIATLERKKEEGKITTEEKRELLELYIRAAEIQGELRENYMELIYDVVTVIRRANTSLEHLVPLLMAGKVEEDTIDELISLLDAAFLFTYGEGSEEYVKKKEELAKIRKALLEGSTAERLEALRAINEALILPINRLNSLGRELSLIFVSGPDTFGRVFQHYDFSMLASLASFTPEEIRELYPDESEREEIASRISDIADELPRTQEEETSIGIEYSIDLVVNGGGSQARAFSKYASKLEKLGEQLED